VRISCGTEVTVGFRGKLGLPVIGGHVDIGAGVRILGPDRFGDHAIIGAKAVVVSDVPGGAVAVGIGPKSNASRENKTGCRAIVVNYNMNILTMLRVNEAVTPNAMAIGVPTVVNRAARAIYPNTTTTNSPVKPT
jgi:hypothetical protein